MYPAVYSYKRALTRELELSIATLPNIDCWNGEVYIVGNRPFLPKHIPHKYLKVAYKWGIHSGNRHNDEICAYLTARDVVGDFIALADDQFILKPWRLMSHNKGELLAHATARTKDDNYTHAIRRTAALLERHHKPTLSYEVHIPFLVKADELTKIERLIPKTNDNVLIRSMLGNYFKRESTQISDVKDIVVDDTTVLYSSSDETFNFEKIKKYAVNRSGQAA